MTNRTYRVTEIVGTRVQIRPVSGLPLLTNLGGYRGGWADTVAMRIADAQLAGVTVDYAPNAPAARSRSRTACRRASCASSGLRVPSSIPARRRSAPWPDRVATLMSGVARSIASIHAGRLSAAVPASGSEGLPPSWPSRTVVTPIARNGA